MYVRFVVGSDAENAARLGGVVRWAIVLDDRGELYRHEVDLLNGFYEWLNEHLPVPPFRRMLRSGKWTTQAVCWFRPDAGPPLRRVWDIVAILRQHDVPVRLIKSNKPGRIVYSDRYQIVAETPRWA
jgi:hypothetical protein